MKINEISQLISIRDYTIQAINNFNLPRESSRELSKMLALLDKRITESILSNDFKEFIKFEDANQALLDVVQNNDIKKGIDPSAPSKHGIVMSNGKAIPDHGLVIK